MPRFSPRSYPHSMRCLRAVVGYVGGYVELAKILDCNESSITRWFRNGEISKKQIIPLTRIMNGKFNASDFLGEYDHVDSDAS